MALAIVEIPTTRAITGGVDTHADVHVAAALDPVGGLLGVAEFPVTPAGYARLLGWLGGFGTVCLVGIEGTGSYGAGLARHVAAAGIRVVEVDRSDRQDRRRQGKSDPLGAVSAARAAQSGRARGAPKGRDGSVEAIRALMVAQAQRPRRADPDHQPGPVPDRDRARRPADPVRPPHRNGPGSRDRIAAAPPRQHRRLRHPDRAARAGTTRAVPRAASPGRLDELIVPLARRPRPRPARPVRRRPRHRRPAPDRRRGPPRAAAVRGGLGAPVRRRPDPRLLGQAHPPPPQPRRRPPGQSRPVADRHHPDELAPPDPRLRRAAHRRGAIQDRDHPLPQALCRPRDLPPPARRR